MDEEFVIVSTSNRSREMADRVSTSLWHGAFIGVCIGICVCGMVQHIRTGPEMSVFLSMIYLSAPWWIWIIPLSLFIAVFYFVEKRYRDEILKERYEI